MRGSAAFRTSVTPGGALAGPWVRNPLWNAARSVPSLDLRFADNKSLVDATTGQNLVTFTRASSGTYVDSQGVIRTATTNLQTWSEDFRNTADAGATRPWTYNTSAVTADNTAAPNGTTTADLIAGAAGTANKFLSNNIPAAIAGFYTFSIYLKQNTEQFVVVRLSDGSANGIRGRFDLAAGTVVITNEGTATGQAATATAVGNGWYRCVVTCSVASLPSSVMQPQLWLNNFASTSLTTNYYAWGAQLEQSSTVGEYIPTTSTINSAPRFDHNPTTGESLGLLVEEQRTNSIRNNTMVGAVAGTPGTLPTNWVTVLNGLTQTVVGAGSSNGINYIDIRFNGTTTSAGFIQIKPDGNAGAISASASQAWVMSSWMAIVGGSTANTTSQQFLLNEYSAGPTYLRTATLASNTLSGGANLTRVSGTITTGASTTIIEPLITLGHNSGAAIDITLRIGMPQLEQGAFATSVIPTTTAAVTRSADVASITGSNFSSWYRQDEGTVFADYKVASSSGNLIGSSDGTNNNRIFLGIASGPLARLLVTTSGSAVASIGVAYALNSAAKTAGVYSTNYFQSATAGVLGTEDVLGGVPTVDRLSIGTNTTQSDFFANGTIKRLTYFPVRLANSTLQQITQ